ncbi:MULTISPECIES: cytochrome P450 [Nocardia]|nr:cytochrome P450 [Nocardia africana]MCC3318001.1 cytochrome P450 [Nocardia africana]
MTLSMPNTSDAAVSGCPVPQQFPSNTDDRPFRIYDHEFSTDPHRMYEKMRRRGGSLVPIELERGVPATLVIGYHTAVRILHDPNHFPADPRAWQKTIAPDCPILPMMEWQPCARNSTGSEHERYRRASVDSINGVDLHALHGIVEDIAAPLISAFEGDATAELVKQYAFPLVFAVLNRMIGCPDDVAIRIAQGMRARFDSEADAGKAMDVLDAALSELVELKHEFPGDDITTRLIAHQAKLDDRETKAQVMSLYAAGVEAQRNLIINTLLLMMTDQDLGAGLLSGSMTTRDALDRVLFNDPPMANFCVTYPRQPILIDNTWLPANQPVVISLAACNNDPQVVGGDRTGNRSHLAWSVGPHACPANRIAYLVAQDAVDQLLDVVPQIALRVAPSELQWRPGPFHRALVALPVKL